MEIIKTYLENMFMNLPKTGEVEKAKKELLEMMEDKYHELKNAGKTENEAVGIVISEFGNLEELAEELGIASYMRHGEDQGAVGRLQLSLDEVEEYMEERNGFGVKVGVGVMLCICSPILLILLGSIAGDSESFLGGAADGLGLTVMFCMIAIAVGLFIYNGMKQKRYEFLEKESFCLDYSTEMYVQEQKRNFQPVFAVSITLGVILCVLSVVPIFISTMIFPNSSIPGAAAIGLMFLLVSIGVFLFIFTGTRNNSYQILLQEGEYQPIEKNANKTLELVSSIYWPIIVCVYLGWSFFTNSWGISWIIWPLAGIFYSVIAAICKAIQGDKAA